MAASPSLPRVPIPRAPHHVNPLTRIHHQQQLQPSKPRPRTSTERGRRYREKRRHHENVLKQQIRELRDEIDRLRRSRSMSCQKALLSRASPHGSLVLLTRELYTIFKHGLEVVDADTMAHVPINEAARKLSAVQFKENFLQRVLDPQVVWGDLTGVDAVIKQWRRHTLSYAKFQLEIDGVDTATGSDESPIVVIHTTLHARFSKDRFAGMFPLAMHHRTDLVEQLVDRDLQFQCVTRFQFSERGQILTYMLDINFVETLLQVLGSASDVAELMCQSLVTPHATLRDDERREEEDAYNGNSDDDDELERNGEWHSNAVVHDHHELQHQRRRRGQQRVRDNSGGDADYEEDTGDVSPERVKFSVRYLLTDEHEAEEKQKQRCGSRSRIKSDGSGFGFSGMRESLSAPTRNTALRDTRRLLPRRQPPRLFDDYEFEEEYEDGDGGDAKARFVSL